MKEYFSKKFQGANRQFQKAKLHLQNFRSKAVVRFANLAKRLDQSHSRNEKKK